MCEKFVYKHLEKIEYVKNLAYFLRNLQTSRANNSRILSIKNAEFSEYFLYEHKHVGGSLNLY